MRWVVGGGQIKSGTEDVEVGVEGFEFLSGIKGNVGKIFYIDSPTPFGGMVDFVEEDDVLFLMRPV